MCVDNVGIVGMGFVGRQMQTLFGDKAVCVDIDNSPEDRKQVSGCPVTFVCVGTPSRPDGGCDASAVEDCVNWIESRSIVIRSTVEPGTTDRLRTSTGKSIIFQPEFLGESSNHPYAQSSELDFLIFGGPTSETSAVADLYKTLYHSSVRFYFTEPIIAELAKYMSNAFWATKIAFCNEFSDVASAWGVDYNVLREIWLSDQRISRDHTFVFPNNRGFGGKCLPKDLLAIIASAKSRGVSPPILRAIADTNNTVWRASQ